ncbi:MAG: hypothetical protein ACLP8S_26655 [Solirubrobacteraceae bacterium]
MKAFPSESTATQKPAETHETESSWTFLSMESGADQVEPFKMNALPDPSMVAQNVAEGQDIDSP